MTHLLYRRPCDIRTTLFVLVMTLYQPLTILSQCPAAWTCESAEVLCSVDALNGFKCANPDIPFSNFPFPTLCFGVGTHQNLNWWAFSGDDRMLDLTFNFTAQDCESGRGIQAGVFEGDCSGISVWDCDVRCNTSSFTLKGRIESCQTYYVWVDGCNFDVCNYTISVNGSAPPQSLPNIPALETRDSICICSAFEICAPDLGTCEPTIEWSVNGEDLIREECIEIEVPDTLQPGDSIVVCMTATIGNPDIPGGICDQKTRCDTFYLPQIPEQTGPCQVVCFEEYYVWHGTPIISSCISPPCTARIQDALGCCVDSIKSFFVTSVPQIGQKDTFICDVGIPFRAENNRVYTDEVCAELIEFKSEVTSPACPGSTRQCDTSYWLNIGRFKYTKDWEIDCLPCSGQLTLTPNVEFDPDCPTFLGQVNITLSWYNELTGDKLGVTDGYGSISVPNPGRYCFDIEATWRGTKCLVWVPECIEVPADIFPDNPPLGGDTIICEERFGTYFTEDRPDRCDFVWSVPSGGGVITTPNPLDASQIQVDWANKTGMQGEVCVQVNSDCGSRDSCITVDFCPVTTSQEDLSSSLPFFWIDSGTLYWSNLDFGKGGKLSLHSIDGRVIQGMVLNSKTNHMDIPKSPAGVYILHWQIDGRKQGSQKIYLLSK